MLKGGEHLAKAIRNHEGFFGLWCIYIYIYLYIG